MCEGGEGYGATLTSLHHFCPDSWACKCLFNSLGRPARDLLALYVLRHFTYALGAAPAVLSDCQPAHWSVGQLACHLSMRISAAAPSSSFPPTALLIPTPNTAAHTHPALLTHPLTQAVCALQVLRVGAFGDPEIQEYLVRELTRTRRPGAKGGTAAGAAAAKEEEDSRLDPIVQAWLVTKASTQPISLLATGSRPAMPSPVILLPAHLPCACLAACMPSETMHAEVVHCSGASAQGRGLRGAPQPHCLPLDCGSGDAEVSVKKGHSTGLPHLPG